MYFEKRIPVIQQLGFKESSLLKLKSYIDLLWSANEELNLISRKMTMEELIDNHVIDCLLPLSKFPPEVKNIADLGTGGGLPAIIYALHFSDKKFYLYEKSIKKQAFLKRCLTITPNLDIRGELPPKLEGMDLIMARAFKPMDVMLDMSRDYYSKGGRYFLLKARAEKIEEELQAARKQFKNLNIKIEPLKSPVLDVERNLVLI